MTTYVPLLLLWQAATLSVAVGGLYLATRLLRSLADSARKVRHER